MHLDIQLGARSQNTIWPFRTRNGRHGPGLSGRLWREWSQPARITHQRFRNEDQGFQRSRVLRR
jgi:hypothetical protein